MPLCRQQRPASRLWSLCLTCLFVIISEKSIAFENKAQQMRGLRVGAGVRMPVTLTPQTVEAKAQAGPHGSRTQSGSVGPLKGLAPAASPRLPRL